MYNDVTTDARETAPQNIGRLAANGVVHREFDRHGGGAAAGRSARCPCSSLWVRQQSHDRDIHDTSLFNLTELNTKFDTGSIKHTLLAGLELDHDTYSNQAYYRNGTCNGVRAEPAGHHQRLRGVHAAAEPVSRRFAARMRRACRATWRRRVPTPSLPTSTTRSS